MSIKTGTVFENNRTQSVRLPVDTRFPPSVKRVHVLVRGNERILTPTDQTWNTFFLGEASVSDDFMQERADQFQSEREPL